MKKLNKINYPIYALNNESDLISKEKGLLSYSFEVVYSCLYGKNSQDFEALRILNNRLIDIIGENYIIQKTDFFFKKDYQDDLQDNSFIEEMNFAHFKGRLEKVQKSFITFTYLPNKYLKYDSTKTNRFLIKEREGKILEPVIDKDYISEENLEIYRRKKDQIISVLTTNKLFSAKLLSGETDFDRVFGYWENLSDDRNSSDVIIDKGIIQIGQNKYRTYSIDNLEDLPDFLNEYSIAYEKSDDSMPIPKTILSPLGVELEGNHVLNQYFYIPPQEDYMKELKKQQNRLGNFSDFFDKAKNGNTNKSSEEEDNDIFADQLKSFRKELRETSQKVVLTHVNLISEHNNINDANFQLKLKENLVDSTDIYFASCIGNAIGLPTDLYMPLTQDQAFSFFYCENYTLGILKGMRLVCPISGNPIKIDFFRTLKANKDIQNFNSWGVGESGSGKSFTLNKILMYQFLAGDHVFNIDGSSSFERATNFVRHISQDSHGFFMKISASTKIGMNPFLKIVGEKIENKLDFLSQLILNILDLEEKKESNFIETLLKIVLKDYYEKHSGEFNFNSFFDFFKIEAPVIIEHEGMSGVIQPNQILFLLRDYYVGGSYEFLLNNSDERLKTLKDNRYITFQVKELKDNPKLFSIVTFLLTNLYKEKLYDLKYLDKIKFIHYDEVWTAMDKPVLVYFIKDTIKTVRSQNGATIFTSQEPEDFFENEIIKNAVINNSELGFITNLTKYRGKADYVRSLLSLTETQTSIIFSLNKKRNPNYNFREFACLVGRKRIDVYGMEVSLEEKAIYESDADEKVILNELDKKNYNNPLITSKQYAELSRKK